jgi:branched-chain amino acid transport system permease protein
MTGPRRHAAALAALGAVLIVVLVVPNMLGRYDLDVGLTFAILAGLAQSWNLIGGIAGQFSLGMAMFLGAGAYTEGLLLTHTTLPGIVTLALSIVVAAVLAALLSKPMFRLRGVYFAVGSLAAATALQIWMVNWRYAGGTQGLSIPLDRLADSATLMQIAGVLGVLATLAAWLLTRTRYGLRVMAVRDQEDAASGLGVNGFRIKLAMFVLSAAFVGGFGAVIAQQQATIQPDSVFGLSWTTNMIVMAIVGGTGTVVGPPLGALIVYYGITKQFEGTAALSGLLTGLVVVAVIRFAGRGVVPLVAQLARRTTLTLKGQR